VQGTAWTGVFWKTWIRWSCLILSPAWGPLCAGSCGRGSGCHRHRQCCRHSHSHSHSWRDGRGRAATAGGGRPGSSGSSGRRLEGCRDDGARASFSVRCSSWGVLWHPSVVLWVVSFGSPPCSLKAERHQMGAQGGAGAERLQWRRESGSGGLAADDTGMTRRCQGPQSTVWNSCASSLHRLHPICQ
jgi:hypothetical protein